MTDKMITATSAPALGDVRAYGTGDTVWLAPDARSRKDFGRYVDALAAALSRGADIRWMGDA